MDRMFGDLSLKVFGEVFDDPRASSAAALQRPATAWADPQAMLLPLIYPRRRRSAMAGMTVFGAGPFASSPALLVGVGFGVDRNHAGGRAGRSVGGAGPRFQQRKPGVLFCNSTSGDEQGERDCMWSESVEFSCGGLVEAPGFQGIHECVQSI